MEELPFGSRQDKVRTKKNGIPLQSLARYGQVQHQEDQFCLEPKLENKVICQIRKSEKLYITGHHAKHVHFSMVVTERFRTFYHS
jgi:hypothetical protein